MQHPKQDASTVKVQLLMWVHQSSKEIKEVKVDVLM